MPYARRKPSIFSECWVARQCLRRVSSGCADSAAGVAVCGEVTVLENRARVEESGSGSPGADDADGTLLLLLAAVRADDVRFVVDVGCPDAGAMRSD
jgi:hypothetical protein